MKFTMRRWMLIAIPRVWPIRRRDLDEAAELEGFRLSGVGSTLSQLVALGLIERVGTGLYRRL